MASINTEGGIHYASDIAARMTSHWHIHGQWPDPGDTTNRGYDFRNSESPADGSRIDRFRGFGGTIQIYLMNDGTLRIHNFEKEAP